MAVIKRFKALRPRKDLIDRVTTRPFDVVSRQQATNEAKNNSYSFFHISRPEVDFPLSVDFDDQKIYRRARKQLHVFENDGILTEDKTSSIYVYRQTSDISESQTGFVALTSVEDYNNNIIKRHELTHLRRERDRFDHFDATDCNTEPVLLMYENRHQLQTILENITSELPDVSFESNDGINHEIWQIKDDSTLKMIEAEFSKIDKLYIGDGHHRIASASKLAKKRMRQIPHCNGTEGFMFFPSVLIPFEDIKILEHNRVIHDLNGLSVEQIIKKLELNFDVSNVPYPLKPTEKHMFGMFLDSEWYQLKLKLENTHFENSLDSNDAQILEDYIVEPIFGIYDVRNTSRMSFYGGGEGLQKLEAKSSKHNGVAFSLYPVSVQEITAISDEGLLLPTTSTWFEPKLRAGMFAYKFHSFRFEEHKRDVSEETEAYIKSVIKLVEEKNSHETEFVQAVTEVLSSLGPVINKNPEYIHHNILERLVEPERVVMFKVPWLDDEGNVHVNRGFRVQFNGSIGPYKGGLRFHPSVNLSVVKFLGFEQTFKNSLTSLPIGGGKGGSDFDPREKSDDEIRRFCVSFMTELYRHIGPNVDVPAGDIGVGKREIGYLFGQYRRIKGAYENGVLTGKDLSYGGSLIRPEATGYGVTYFAEQILKDHNTDFKNKEVAISGFGNVAWGVCQKVRDLGGKVVTISGPEGYIYDEEGIVTQEKIDYMVEMRQSTSGTIKDYAEKFGVPFYEGVKPWERTVDIIIPCATQNEILDEDARKIVANGVKYVVEGSNMPTTNTAMHILQEAGVIIGPAKAANAGGVATSALEMSQNAMRLNWTAKEVEEKLQGIMKQIYKACVLASSRYGYGYDLVAGANIAGFVKVAEAMIAQGIY
jgi:glutamate dehydrogenase (NADP+)